jgi:hypothetical protein
MPVGTYLYLHAVGACNPSAVPGLARLGAERGSYRQVRSAGSTSVGKPCTEGFGKNIISVHRHKDLPHGQSDMSFPRLNTPRYSPDEGAGAAFAKCFLVKMGTDGSAKGRGCWRWRRAARKQRLGTALASSRQPCESFRSLVGARPYATQDGGGSQPEEWHGLAAAVLKITRRRKSPVGGLLGKHSHTHHLLRTGDSILVFYQPLP